MRGVPGIAWAEGGTVGHLTVTSPLIDGVFTAQQGKDGIACCHLVPAGKYRNGAARAWCRTHQQYWGVKADLAALAADGVQRCARHAAPMGYVLDPLVLDLPHLEQLAIACDADGIHLDAQPMDGRVVHASVPAFALACPPLFGDPAIVQLNVTPPALQALVAAHRSGKPAGCVNCARCGHPHLDLGAFAVVEHRRHYCGNCGHDATHSAHAIISHPLFALLDAYPDRLRFIDSNVRGHTVL